MSDSQPKPAGTLQLSPDDMRSLGYKIVDILVGHFAGLAGEKITGRRSRAELEAKLREPFPELPTPIDGLLEQVTSDVFATLTHVDHPRFFAYVPGPGNYVGAMAEALSAGFNVFAGAWVTGSGPAEVELVTIDWLRQICGMPASAGGLFVSGGSMANLTALAVARHTLLGEDFERGTIYYSDQTHSSIDRALRVLGFRGAQIRKLGSDLGCRLRLDELDLRVAADRAGGERPFCVVANAGTTSSGAVDPLGELAAYCRGEGLWLHVDGAYGAPAMLCESGRDLLAGMELADSLSLDPHKWLFQPFETGCLLLREGGLLRDTFHILPDYLKDSEPAQEEINYRDHGIQLTRSFRALKLWMSLKAFGLEAFRQGVAHGVGLAEYAESRLRGSDHWEIVTPAQLGIVTFRLRSGDAMHADATARRLVEEMFDEGFAMLSTTVLHGRLALRFCTINPRTTEEDIQETIERLERKI